MLCCLCGTNYIHCYVSLKTFCSKICNSFSNFLEELDSIFLCVCVCVRGDKFDSYNGRSDLKLDVSIEYGTRAPVELQEPLPYGSSFMNGDFELPRVSTIFMMRELDEYSVNSMIYLLQMIVSFIDGIIHCLNNHAVSAAFEYVYARLLVCCFF